MAETPDFTIKQGATSPPLPATLTDAAGAPIPLSGTTVRFRMKPLLGGGALVDRAATIVNPTAGEVRYDWQAADTALAGYYRAEFRVIFANGADQPVPSDDYLTVLVKTGLA